MIGPSARPRATKYDLRRLTALIGAAIALFGVLLIVTVAWTGQSANRDAIERDQALIDNALDESIARVLNEQKSVAWWDDAVEHIETHGIDRDWVDNNFGLYFSETYGHDETYIVDDHDRVVYAYLGRPAGPEHYNLHRVEIDPVVDEVRTGEQRFARQRDGAFRAGQSSAPPGLAPGQTAWAAHLESVNGKPAIVAAMAIVPNVNADLLTSKPYLVVSIVYLNAKMVGDIGRSMLRPTLTLTRTAPRGTAPAVEPLLADDGTPVGYLSWRPRRPGQTLLNVILPLVAIGVLAAGLFAANTFRRLRKSADSLAEHEAEARHEAKHDPLSGLPNRHYFAERLDERLERSLHGENERVVVAYIDVDRFKDINDTLGHQAGDELIKSVAERVRAHLGPDDFVARFGGDEFAVMRSPAGRDCADDLADRLAAAFEDNFFVGGQNIQMTASVGIATAPDDGVTTAQLMRHADIALYEAKAQGRDRAMIFCANMAWQVEERRAIELELRDAMRDGQLEMLYQPLISCATNEIVGAEALLRWNHPEKGLISPTRFIPVAEDAGLMQDLGAWVLDRAFADAGRWRTLEMAVNLSPVQFRHPDLEGMLHDLAERHCVDPSRIVLEITEGVLLEATDHTKRVLDAIGGQGFKTALDDFGTGYSSLAYLGEFKFDKIKIDRSFVTGIAQTPQAMTIVQAVVTLGRGLGMAVVAEGVETEADAALMRLIGCSELQGYYFARPLSVEAFERLLHGGARDMARQIG
jgi:diguanylate cyclase (GGDEF)-like protein